MKYKINIIALSLVVLSALILFWTLNNYLAYEKKEKKEASFDIYLQELNEQIQQSKNLVLTASVLLSKNDEIISCLKKFKHKDCLIYMQNAKKSLLNTPIFDDIKIHIHDDQLKSFVRLWELEEPQNEELTLFRGSLTQVKQQKKPLSCIEVGRYSMLIRGISPILDNDNYIGSIEVIIDFDKMIEYFNKKDIQLYVLMHRKFQDIANKINFSKQQQLQDYLIVNKTHENTDFLNNINFNGTGYLKQHGYYLLYTPVFNINNEAIGAYVMKIYDR